MVNRKYFGTDGVRGKVGAYPITPDFALKLGWAARKECWLLKVRKWF